MRRPGYKAAIDWVALNDSAGVVMTAEECGDMITAVLIADLFDVPSDKVGRDLFAARERFKKEESKS